MGNDQALHRNAYVPQERGMPPRGGLDDDEEEAEQVSNELEQVNILRVYYTILFGTFLQSRVRLFLLSSRM